jgi:membrane protein
MSAGTSSNLSLVKQTFLQWSSHNATRLSAALSLYTMMSLAPLLVVALTIMGLIYHHHEDAQSRLGSQATTFVGPGGADAINQMMSSSANHPKGGLVAGIIGFVIAVISGSSLFGSLQDALNTMWDVKPKPDAGWRVMLRDRAMSAGMILVAAILLLASFVASAVLSMVVKHLGGWLAGLSYVGDLVVSFCVVTALFAMIYKFLPDVKIVWSDVWLGAAITAALFILGKYGLTLYFRFASVASPYGAAGSLAALLIWVYYSSMLIFFGAAFTRVYAQRKGKPIEPNEYAMCMSLEDRARQGTALPQEIEQKRREMAAGSPVAPAARGRGERAANVTPHGNGNASRAIWAAGAGLALGTLGALGFNNTTERRVRREAEAMALHHRMKRLERRAGGAARLRDQLQRLEFEARVERLEDGIRATARHGQRAQHAQGQTTRHARSWTDRIVEAVKQGMK